MEVKNLKALISKIIDYNQSRGWKQEPQDLAKSIMIEAAELLEHFQWDGGSKNGVEGKDLKEIKHEVADVFWYLVIFCHTTGIDLADAVNLKYKHNEEKYPIEKFAGSHIEEFYKSQKKKYRDLKNK